MKTTKEIARPLLEKIATWKKPAGKVIIGIEGYSASGKSTLLKYLASQRPDILPIEVDDFLASQQERDAVWHEPPRLEPDWRKAPWFQYENLDALLQAYEKRDQPFETQIYNRRTKEFNGTKTYDLSRPVLVAEGVLLLNSPLAQRLDHLVYLDVPFQLADQRRWARHLEKAPTADRVKHLAWVERFFANYSLYLEKCRPQEEADLVLQVD